VSDKPCEDDAMTTEDLHERLRGIQRCWDQALADLQEVSGGLEAIVKTPRENDLVAIAKHYDRDPKVFAIGMFDAVIMLKALTTVLEMTEPMFKKISPFTLEQHLEAHECLARFGSWAKGHSGATSPTLPGVGRTRRMQFP
jgi:hypothetical protein